MFDRRITVLLGGLGSGKTAVAASFAAALAREHPAAALVDLDVAHPGFRSVEVQRTLAGANVALVRQRGDDPFAGTPVLLSTARRLLGSKEQWAVLDVGADARSAAALAGLADALPPAESQHLLVLNFCRPFTQDVEEALMAAREVEQATGCKLTGLLCNTHLMDSTTEETIRRGLDLGDQTAQRLGLKVVAVAVDEALKPRLPSALLRDRRILPLSRELRPPPEPPVRVNRSPVGPTFGE